MDDRLRDLRGRSSAGLAWTNAGEAPCRTGLSLRAGDGPSVGEVR